jgi:mannose-6-phosphate isomerase-like protein (cupin superfamily)
VSYSKDIGEVSARYRPAGEVPSVTYPSGTHVVFTAPGSATNGQYGLFEWNMSGTPGGASAHFHKTFSESFYVMEGTVRLFDGEAWIDATKGDFLYVPQGAWLITTTRLPTMTGVSTIPRACKTTSPRWITGWVYNTDSRLANLYYGRLNACNKEQP